MQFRLLGLKDPSPVFPGLISKKEGVVLFKLARRLSRKAVIVEIGCFNGLSSAYLLQGTKDNEATLYSIDPFDSYAEYQLKEITNIGIASKKPSRATVDYNLTAFGLKNYILIEGLSFDVVKNWSRYIDLLWIDGNHDYEAVKQDYLEWEPFLKIGGYIAFHDSNKIDNSQGWSKGGWPGPTKLVNEVIRSGKWKRIKEVDSITYATKVF